MATLTLHGIKPILTDNLQLLPRSVRWRESTPKFEDGSILRETNSFLRLWLRISINMNDIMKHEKNHPCPSSTAICKMITQHMSATDFFVPDNNVRLTEDQRRIDDLYLQLSEAKDKLNINKEALEEKTTKLNIENQKLKKIQPIQKIYEDSMGLRCTRPNKKGACYRQQKLHSHILFPQRYWE
ncbi:uncharacterized protein LOC107224090 isoform X3 [Neodiprion lecontei]|uniref:Uncharacterized protein LOC107224090 isoform X3 n=1 Tax=Neodiprion lecontei TaxID=441921 RepID=A0ABM3G8H3_NEOLC|nr:uncharacterized protein LOC107224090 isoform X3 [Neodiprion lecontei]